MKQNGSMTAAMSLMLMILLSLAAVSIQASRIICSRTQAVNGIDTGMYSLFSEYDRDLLENYNLFFLDAGYGTREINLSQLISQTEHYMEPVLSSGLTKCVVQACAVDGFRLASDNKGKAAEQQMLRYMKENLGNTGIKALKKKLADYENTMKEQEKTQETGIEEILPEGAAPMEEISAANNPLEIIKNIKNYGLLGLVLPEDMQVSEKIQNKAEVLSERGLQIGTGEFSDWHMKSGSADKLLLQEYALEKLGNFAEKKSEGSLEYQVEYVLGGKKSDKENLSYVVNRLMLIRQASNIAFLYTDGQKRAELQACASALSFLFLIPEGMVLVQAVLAAGWAYMESLSDVRILLSGGKIPLVKSQDSWKTQIARLQEETTTTGLRGLDYEEHLRILLTFVSKETIVLRTMDMIEQNMRKIPEKENFCFDACLDILSMSFLIKGEENKIWQGDRIYSYDM